MTIFTLTIECLCHRPKHGEHVFFDGAVKLFIGSIFENEASIHEMFSSMLS